MTTALPMTTVFDSGLRAASAFSARAAYVFLCLTLCWGIFTTTGWIQRASGHHAMRGSHTMLAAATIATAATHVAMFGMLQDQLLTVTQIVVPFADGTLRHGLGIIALWLLVATLVTGGLQRLFSYRNWLRLHQLGYAAFALAVVHSWLGAYYNGNLSLLWVLGLTVSTPALVMVMLRVMPTHLLVRARLLDGDFELHELPRQQRDSQLSVSVDNQRCHHFGFCQAEAPDVFSLQQDGRLAYRERPELSQNSEVRSAARACPTRAIRLEGSAS